jgi:hypothetical protein
MVRFKHVVSLIAILPFIVPFACKEDSKSAPDPAPQVSEVSPEPAKDVQSNPSSDIAGSLVLQIDPKDGAPASSIANARVTVEGRPEIVATTNEDGQAVVDNILPGTLNVLVLSADGTNLLSGASKYGLQLPGVIISAGEAKDIGRQTLKETGSLTGTVEFLENPNQIDLAGTEVFIPGTSFDATTDAQGSFTLAGLPDGKYPLYFRRDGFSLTVLESVNILEAQSTNLGVVTLSLSTGPEGKIAVVADAEITVNSSIRKISTDRNIAIALSYDSDAVLMKVSDEPSFLNKQWEAVSTTVSWDFETDGLKAIYVMYSDLNGLESSPYKDEVYIDTQAPVITSTAILSGLAQSASRDVSFDLDAADSGSGVGYYKVASSSLALATAEWLAFSSSPTYHLGGQNALNAGPTSIFVMVKDYAGRISEVVEDSILFGNETIIHEGLYDKNMVFDEERSPYLIEGIAVFQNDVTFGPGAVVRLSSTNGIKGGMVFKGKVTALGADDAITIQSKGSLDTSSCVSSILGSGFTGSEHVHLDFGQSLPGVSDYSRFENVNFVDLNIIMNGGIFDSSSFRAGCNSGYFGNIQKKGRDLLNIKNSEFEQWASVIVSSGIGATTIQENSGCFRKIIQNNGATGTRLINNNLNPANSGEDKFGPCRVFSSAMGLQMEEPILRVSTGSIDLSNTRFTIAEGALVFVDGYGRTESLELTDFDVLSDKCAYVARAHAVDIEISNARLECHSLVFKPDDHVTSPGIVKISSSQVSVSKTLFELPTVQYNKSYTFTLTGNQGSGDGRTYGLTCKGSDAAKLCDFARIYNTKAQWADSPIDVDLDFHNNTFHCNAGASTNCRGGFVSVALQCPGCGAFDFINTVNWEVNLSGSSFNGKQLTANIATTGVYVEQETYSGSDSYDSQFGANHPNAEDQVGISIYDLSYKHTDNANLFTKPVSSTYNFNL